MDAIDSYFLQPISGLYEHMPIIRTAIIVIVLFALFSALVTYLKKILLKHTKSKHHKSDIEIFSKIIRIIFLVFLVFAGFSSYFGSWTGIGISAGLLTAAVGWALQRPITGVAAWVMIVTKRPFEIGDRIMIGSIKGDVISISLSHIHLREVGGLVKSEHYSGRTVLLPNSTLFEERIINYTLDDEYVLDEAVTLVTYESDLEKAKDICLKSTNKFLDPSLKKKKELPHLAIVQKDSGIEIRVRYMATIANRVAIKTKIHDDIITTISKEKHVDIAYPHMHLVR